MTRWVVRRRGDVAIATAAVLVAAAAPALALRATFSDHRSLPRDNAVRVVGDTIEDHYLPNLEYPVTVAVPLLGRSPDVALAPIARTPGTTGFRALATGSRRFAVGQVVLARGPTSATSQAVIRSLRALAGHVRVGGRTAEFADLRHSIVHRAPLAILAASVVTLLVLLTLTGSLVIGVKALVFNALGLAAAFGLLVLLSGREVDLAAAVVIVAATFGLATDYAILLLARIAEAHRSGLPDAEAIAAGVRASGPIISRAALLICVPLLAQATSAIPLVRQLGIGQTLGVLIDATLIRLLLVPATMALLGRANWWPGLRPYGRLRRFAP